MRSSCLILLVCAAHLLAAAGDTVVDDPARPKTTDSLTFDLFNMNLCCCTQYYNHNVSVGDTTITLYYEPDVSSCALCYCIMPGSWTKFTTGPVKAGTYGIYKAEGMYCEGPVCPQPPGPIVIERVGEVTVVGPAAASAQARQRDPAEGRLWYDRDSEQLVAFLAQPQVVTVRVYAPAGRLVDVRRMRLGAGRTSLTIPASKLGSGAWLAEMRGRDFVHTTVLHTDR